MKSKAAPTIAAGKQAAPQRRSRQEAVPLPQHRGLIGLQRTAGNRATVASLAGGVVPSGVVASGVVPRVQRDYVPGLHKQHKGAHSEADAARAAKFIEDALAETTKLDDAVKAPGSTVEAAKSAAARMATLSVQVDSQFAVVNSVNNTVPAKARIATARQSKDRIVGAKGRTEATEYSKSKDVMAARVKADGNRLLVRAEGQAMAAVDALATVITTPLAATKAAKEVAEAKRRAEGFASQLTDLDKDAARFHDLAALTTAYAGAAARAVTLAGQMEAVAADLVAAHRAVADRTAEAAEADRAARSNLEAAKKATAEAADYIVYVQGFSDSLNETLDEIELLPEANPPAIADMRAEALAGLDRAQAAEVDARRQETAAADALALLPSTVGQATIDAGTTATARGVTAAATATAAGATLTDQQQLRTLAGGEPALVEFQSAFPDQPRLVSLLDTLGPARLRSWMYIQGIGAPKVVALLDLLGSGPLGNLVTVLGGDRATALVAHFAADRVHQMVVGLGSVRLLALVSQYTSVEVDTLVAGLSNDRLVDLIDHLSPTIMRRTALTTAQFADLLASFDAPGLRAMVDALGDGALADLQTKFTGAELLQYRTDLGGQAKLTELMVTRKLKADALKHYPPARLATFVGAGATAMGHLVQIDINPGGANPGAISGGHDEATFDWFIATTWPPTAQVKATKDATTATRGTMKKVSYTTYRRNGSVWSGGSKTLIPGLAGAQAAWQAVFNEAIWESIRNKRFVFDAGQFTGVTDGGLACAGYHNAGDEVDTVYPNI